jgi:hypothetical protein
MSTDRALKFSWHQTEGEEGETIYRGAFAAQQLLNSIDGFVDLTPASTSHRWRCSGNFTLLHDETVLLSADIALPSFREKDLRIAKINCERMFLERLANIRAGINAVEAGVSVNKGHVEPIRSMCKILVLRALVQYWRANGVAPKRNTLVELVNGMFEVLDGKRRSLAYINKCITDLVDAGKVSAVDDPSLSEGYGDGRRRLALVPLINEHGHAIRMERAEEGEETASGMAPMLFFLTVSGQEYKP